MLKSHRRAIAQFRVQPLSITEDFYVLENAGSGLLDGLEGVMIDAFGFPAMLYWKPGCLWVSGGGKKVM